MLRARDYPGRDYGFFSFFQDWISSWEKETIQMWHLWPQLLTKGSLEKRHPESVHEQNKPFKCDICDKTFNQKSNMEIHVSKHFRDVFTGATGRT
jgi:uncharacterized Zn-finger protein